MSNSRDTMYSVLATVEANLSNGVYACKIVENGHPIQARLCGKMAQRRIRIVVGDTVTCEISPYDLNNGRITWRHQVINGEVVQKGQERANFNSVRRQPGEKHWRGRK